MAVPPNLIALDVGNKRVGIATANGMARLPNVQKAINRSDKFFEELKKVIESEDIGIVVVGLPKSLNGQETDQTRLTREFVDELKNSVKLPVYFEDESLTSVRAEESLGKLSKSKAYTKDQIDSLSASYILDYFITNHPEIVNG